MNLSAILAEPPFYRSYKKRIAIQGLLLIQRQGELI